MNLYELIVKCKDSGIILQELYFDVFQFQFKKGISTYEDALGDFTPDKISKRELGTFLYCYIVATYEWLCDKIGKSYTTTDVYCDKSENDYYLYCIDPNECETAEEQVEKAKRFDERLNSTDIHYKRHGVIML